MMYLLYAVLYFCCTPSSLIIIASIDREGSLNSIFLGDGSSEDEKERDERIGGN
jgi:hypothetical protein